VKPPAGAEESTLATPQKISSLEGFISQNPALAEGLKGFLAGVIEGDGSISIRIDHPKRSRLGFTFIPHIDITGTSQPLIETCNEIMTNMGGKPQMCRYTRRTRAGTLVYAARVFNQEGVLKILEEIYPYLVSKKEAANVTMDFCRLRLSKPQKLMRNQKGRIIDTGNGYTSKEVGLYEKVLGLNKKSRYYAIRSTAHHLSLEEKKLVN
jgi:hypothetical protein